ncbi:MAG TPA: hypothetical protein VES73_12615 [Lamprocystis sp. (in: g-proteobacteria)]|nr:hypothetical protein [Lamprocystis sp. (in: g-proteobacteria)]
MRTDITAAKMGFALALPIRPTLEFDRTTQGGSAGSGKLEGKLEGEREGLEEALARLVQNGLSESQARQLLGL